MEEKRWGPGAERSLAGLDQDWQDCLDLLKGLGIVNEECHPRDLFETSPNLQHTEQRCDTAFLVGEIPLHPITNTK